MKKYRSIFLVFLLTLFWGCTPKTTALRVGMNADYPPFEYRENGVLTGFDVTLAREIGIRLGYSVNFIELEFDELLPALHKGQIDLAISAVTINERRLEIVDFSKPYFCVDQVLIGRMECDINITDDNQLSGYRLGAQSGTTGQYYLEFELAENGILNADKIFVYKNNLQGIAALINQEIDLYILDDTTAKAFTRIKPVKICHILPTDEEYGIALPKNSPLTPKVNTALDEIMRSSRWTQMITSYMSE